MGGEHEQLAGSEATYEGSPPHGRGTPPGWPGRGGCSIWAHPRMGGEHLRRRSRLRCTAGSPPHGRGTLLANEAAERRTGLTPAWAGNTHCATMRAIHDGAHPRMGGEHHCRNPVTVPQAGSPPHGRGTPSRPWREQPTPGLTPAWAGNTAIRPMASAHVQAHPRMGGEHNGAPTATITVTGSPPHGRGTHLEHPRWCRRCGLTPAWAGNTHLLGWRSNTSKAHPRMGGEHGALRGCAGPVDGLTPAWAGNTCAAAASSTREWAHPRMGGEHWFVARLIWTVLGSPPHGRGTRGRDRRAGAADGLTPAWAGNTSPISGCGRRHRAHPRMGGEHPHRGGARVWPGGSPPHGRGTHDRRRTRLGPDGLTPAWAGNTAYRVVRCRIDGAHPRMGGEHVASEP